jgi:serine/threonine protein kinase
MTARPAIHLLLSDLCNFSLTASSPAMPRQGGRRPRRTQESMDSHDTLIAPRHLPGGERGPVERVRAGRIAPLFGRYRLLERLGAGGFGVVWRAHDELLDREVAVKVIPLPAGEDRERATREALACARLAHPAIVALYEACAGEDAFYLISELVHGETLAQLIAREALGDEESLEIGLALIDALLHAHRRGVIHRDIKPQNVLVPHFAEEPTAPAPGERAPQGLTATAKLTDFGGALLAGEETLTRTGDVLGTLAYMAPEQIEGREVGEPADLYSLALVLYEALSGVNPVRGPTPAATARRIGSELPALEGLRRDLPRALTRALDLALDPDPRRRGTLPELSEAIADALHHGLGRSPWRRRPIALEGPGPTLRQAPHSPLPTIEGPLPRRSPERPAEGQSLEGHHAEERPVEERPDTAGWLTISRLGLIAASLSVCIWQIAASRPGVGLIVLCAALPLVLLVRRPGPQWAAAALAPVLGLAGLAGAFPALAGQATRWRARALLGALGYWWLRLAELPIDRGARHLWLGPPAGLAGPASWEGSLSTAATHAVGPLLGLALLLGAALWGLAAALLPWVVRGRSALLDALAAIIWAGALAASVPLVDRGFPFAGGSGMVGAAIPSPRGVILGSALGGMLAVVARAVRGPV